MELKSKSRVDNCIKFISIAANLLGYNFPEEMVMQTIHSNVAGDSESAIIHQLERIYDRIADTASNFTPNILKEIVTEISGNDNVKASKILSKTSPRELKELMSNPDKKKAAKDVYKVFAEDEESKESILTAFAVACRVCVENKLPLYQPHLLCDNAVAEFGKDAMKYRKLLDKANSLVQKVEIPTEKEINEIGLLITGDNRNLISGMLSNLPTNDARRLMQRVGDDIAAREFYSLVMQGRVDLEAKVAAFAMANRISYGVVNMPKVEYADNEIPDYCAYASTLEYISDRVISCIAELGKTDSGVRAWKYVVQNFHNPINEVYIRDIANILDIRVNAFEIMRCIDPTIDYAEQFEKLRRQSVVCAYIIVTVHALREGEVYIDIIDGKLKPVPLCQERLSDEEIKEYWQLVPSAGRAVFTCKAEMALFARDNARGYS